MSVSVMADRSMTSSSNLSVLDYLKTCVFALDADYRVHYMNQSAEALTRTSLHRAIGQTLDQLFDGSDEITQLCDRAVEAMGSMEIRETVIVSLADPEAPIDVDVTAIPTEDGGIIIELRNIATRLKIKREKEMKSQNSVSRTIIKQLAHEIKNPLGGLRGAAQLLSRRLPSPDLLEYTDIIISETDRLVQLVDAMLGPNRPTHRQAVNVHRVLDHVSRLIEAEADPSTNIVRDFDPSLPQIFIDEDQMTQAILNLARNAMQAIDTGGTIIFRSRIETGVTIGEQRHSMIARIDIQDDGEGVPEELREQIFYPLVTGRVEGVGLGLAISHELVSRHDGLLKLQSGEPTVFSIYLPLSENEL